MNGAFWHLAVNHVPVVGAPYGFGLLAAALWRKSDDLARAGYLTLAGVALTTFVADQTGRPAAHLVRGLLGVSADMIRPHAHAAGRAVMTTGILGLAAILGLFPFRNSRAWLALVLAGSLAVSLQLAWVAHLGGLIRHPEIEMDGTAEPRAAPTATPPLLKTS